MVLLRQVTAVLLLLGALPAGAVLLPQDARQQPHAAAAAQGLEAAARALRAGDHETARRELDRLLAMEPHNARALNLKGVLEATQGNAAQAEEFFRQALRAAPHLAAAHGNLARLLRQTGRLDLAVAEFEQAVGDSGSSHEFHAEYLDAMEELVLAQRRAADQEAALATLLSARRLLAGDPRVLYDFGIQAMGMDLEQDGLDALRQAHRLAPDSDPYLYALAHAEQQAGHAEASVQLFHAYIEKQPADATAHFGLGLALLGQNRDEEAASEFAVSIRLQPAQSESYYQLGRLAEAAGEFAQARRQYESALGNDPRHAGAATSLGAMLYRDKQYDASLELLRRAVQAAPEFAQAHYQLGLTLSRMGHAEESRAELERARQLTEAADRKKVTRRRLAPAEAPPAAPQH